MCESQEEKTLYCKWKSKVQIKSTPPVTVWGYIWGIVGRRGRAPNSGRSKINPESTKAQKGWAGAWVGRRLVKHWRTWISRHCLVKSHTGAPVSGADTYLGGWSEPIQRLSVPERQRWRCMGPGRGTRHVGPAAVKPKAGQIGQQPSPHPTVYYSFCVFLCSDSDKRGTEPSRTTNRHCLISPMWARAGTKEVPSH